jgi:hypothetical protein
MVKSYVNDLCIKQYRRLNSYLSIIHSGTVTLRILRNYDYLNRKKDSYY